LPFSIYLSSFLRYLQEKKATACLFWQVWLSSLMDIGSFRFYAVGHTASFAGEGQPLHNAPLKKRHATDALTASGTHDLCDIASLCGRDRRYK
jgi:hypothetical protein